jgi:hypothetical protein
MGSCFCRFRNFIYLCTREKSATKQKIYLVPTRNTDDYIGVKSRMDHP